MPLFRVKEEEVQKILAMKVPKHPKARFNNAEFRDLVAHAMSMEYDEKVWIVENVGTMSQAAVDSFLTMLRAERAHFEDINRRAEEAITARLPVN